MSLLDGQEIELPCENCRRKTKKSIRWIKANKEFTCACGTVIVLDANQLKAEIAKLERSLAGLQGMFKKR